MRSYCRNPLNNDKNVNLNYIHSVIDFIEESKCCADSTVALRSTVPVGTSENLQNYLIQNGSKTKIVMSPERTVEGKAIEELFSNSSRLLALHGFGNSCCIQTLLKVIQ